MEKKKIYLSATDPDMLGLRSELFKTLQKAGFEVLPVDLNVGGAGIVGDAEGDLNKCDCSIHLVGHVASEILPDGKSLTAHLYEMARLRQKRQDNFKMFIWHPHSNEECNDPYQATFLNDLRNGIDTNITYTNVPSGLQLVEDLRSMLEVSKRPEMSVVSTDIFFISNMVDEPTAEEITDMLSDVTRIEKMVIDMDGEMDFEERSTQQVNNSKLAVVYFKESADWAIPFAQQIWKNVGGAASRTPILVIGDEDPETNKNKGFKAPKVISMVMSGELIPLEIKVQYDKAQESA